MLIVNPDSFRFLRRDDNYERCIVDGNNITRLNTRLILDPVLEFKGKFYIINTYNETISKGILNVPYGRKLTGEGKYSLCHKLEITLDDNITNIYILPTSTGQLGYNTIIEDMEFYCSEELRIGRNLTINGVKIALIKRDKPAYMVDHLPIFKYIGQKVGQ